MENDLIYKISEHIVNNIINDISSRNGIGNEWDSIDDDIKSDIVNEWIKISYTQIKQIDEK